MGCSASTADGNGNNSSGNADKPKGSKKQLSFLEFLATKPEEIDLTPNGRKESGWPDMSAAQPISELPSQIWECVESCKILKISGHEIKQIPKGLFSMINLEELEFSDGSLTEIPADIAKLTKLKIGAFYANQIASIPTEIGTLSQLEDLNLFANKIKKVPAEINNLASLTSLNLGDNQFMKFPDIGNLKNLENLQIHWGKVIMCDGDWSGLSIKSFMANRCKLVRLPELPPTLEEMDVNNNPMESFPASLATCKNLKELQANHNLLTTIPVEILSDKLELLKMGNNKITEVPPEIGNCVNLKAIFLNNNAITTLPAGMSNLTQLIRIDITNNPGLSGDHTTVSKLKDIATKNKGKFFEEK